MIINETVEHFDYISLNWLFFRVLPNLQNSQSVYIAQPKHYLYLIIIFLDIQY